MRIQVYSEELGEGVQVVEQVSRNGERFYGLRVWLKSPAEILEHSTPEDDDRSAVTFWARSEYELYLLADKICSALCCRAIEQGP